MHLPQKPSISCTTIELIQIQFFQFCSITKILFSFFTELGHVLHTCEGDLVCKCTNEKIPYFNAPVYLENKSQIGKVDDIFGPMTEFVSLT